MSEFTDGLREMADFIDEHPDVEPNVDNTWFFKYIYDQEEFVRLARELGPCEKTYRDLWVILAKSFGPHRLEIYTNRSHFCEKVKVGERVVRRVVKNPPTEEVVEPVYEWRCRPILDEEEPLD